MESYDSKAYLLGETGVNQLFLVHGQCSVRDTKFVIMLSYPIVGRSETRLPRMLGHFHRICPISLLYFRFGGFLHGYVIHYFRP